MGGIRKLLVNNLNNIASDNFVKVLRNIKTQQDKTDIATNQNELETKKLISLPKEMLLKTSEYLEIPDIKQLTSTCIDFALSLKSEINKIDIRVVTYDDLILNDTLTFERNQFDEFGKIYRVRKDKTLDDCIDKYNIVKGNTIWKAFWNPTWNSISLFPIWDMKHYVNRNLNVISFELFQTIPRLFVLDFDKCTPIIEAKKGWSIMIKYFDVVNQRLYIMDLVTIDEYASLRYGVLTQYIKDVLMNKHPNIFKPINQNKDMLTHPLTFKYYQQNGFKPTDIEEILLNGKGLSTRVLIFELNICNKDIMSRFQNLTPKWKQELKTQGKPFCMNVKTFWSYHYGIYKTKKELNIL